MSVDFGFSFLFCYSFLLLFNFRLKDFNRPFMAIFFSCWKKKKIKFKFTFNLYFEIMTIAAAVVIADAITECVSVSVLLCEWALHFRLWRLLSTSSSSSSRQIWSWLASLVKDLKTRQRFCPTERHLCEEQPAADQSKDHKVFKGDIKTWFDMLLIVWQLLWSSWSLFFLFLFSSILHKIILFTFQITKAMKRTHLLYFKKTFIAGLWFLKRKEGGWVLSWCW